MLGVLTRLFRPSNTRKMKTKIATVVPWKKNYSYHCERTTYGDDQ